MEKIEDLQKSTIKELEKNLAKARMELYKIRTAIKTEKSHKSSDLKSAKKYVAQILTVLNFKKKTEIQN